MFTLKIIEGEEGTFKNPEDAVKYMVEDGFKNDVSVYDINTDKAYNKTICIYDTIKKYNKGKPLDDQILPSNPVGFRGIVGCLGVQVYCITLGTYKRNHECVALFSGYNTSVLDTSKEKANVRPGVKALASLSLLPKIYEI